MNSASYDTVVIGSGFGGALVAHALNAADERLMYYDYGKGPDSISEELFDDTFKVMYRMWCSALGIQPGSEEPVV